MKAGAIIFALMIVSATGAVEPVPGVKGDGRREKSETAKVSISSPSSLLAPSSSDRALLDAIRQVESGGDDRGMGDGGKARGPYQLHRDYWLDGCRQGGVSWSFDEFAFSQPHCEQVIRWYWQLYGASSDEAKARLHNGGPSWRRLPATEAYWHKVQKRLSPH